MAQFFRIWYTCTSSNKLVHVCHVDLAIWIQEGELWFWAGGHQFSKKLRTFWEHGHEHELVTGVLTRVRTSSQISSRYLYYVHNGTHNMTLEQIFGPDKSLQPDFTANQIHVTLLGAIWCGRSELRDLLWLLMWEGTVNWEVVLNLWEQWCIWIKKIKIARALRKSDTFYQTS